ncbi:MAG: DNA repair protein RadC [Oscillospiraceae bacterium]
MENPHDGHRQRLRERVLREGIESVEPHVALEYLLFHTVARADTNPIAHRLIARFGSFSGVLEAPYEELMKVEGVGPASAAFLQMIPSLSRRYLSDKFKVGEVLDSAEKLVRFFVPQFVGRNNEAFLVACLDKKRKLIHCELLMEGSPDSVPIDLRRIVEIAMRTSATAVVLAHNHPRGFAIPSISDQNTTLRIREVLRPLSIELVDHIIIAMDDGVSLAETGLLSQF